MSRDYTLTKKYFQKQKNLVQSIVIYHYGKIVSWQKFVFFP